MGAMAPGLAIQDRHPEIFVNSHLVAGDVVTVETEGLAPLVMRVCDEEVPAAE